MSGGGSARLRGGSGKSCRRWGDTGGGTTHGPGISLAGGLGGGGDPVSAPPGGRGRTGVSPAGGDPHQPRRGRSGSPLH